MNEKIKQHFEKHKLAYTCAGSLLAGVVIGRAVLGQSPTITNDINMVASPVINTTTTIANGGYSRKLVECLETGEIWKSVKDAAQAAGVDSSTMSKHLNGAKDHVNNLHYTIAGLATN